MACLGDSKDWYSSEEFLTRLERFHDVFGRFPNMKTANQTHTSLLGKLKCQMTELCDWKMEKRFRYVGSVYEKLKIGRPDEYDVMVVIEDDSLQVNPSSTSVYSYLSPKQQYGGSVWDKVFDENGNVSSIKVRSEFYSIISRAIEKRCFKKRLDVSLKMRAHGPAIQIDVSDKKKKHERKEMFSVDLVPALKINGEFYVAKPYPADDTNWRYCTSEQEKAKLKGIDTHNGCRRKCVRILKAISEKEAKFQTLVSFNYKMAMFHVADMYREQEQWTQQKMGQRLMDMLAFLQSCLERHQMQHFFKSDINLLESIPHAACQDLANRIERLRNNKEEFYKLLG